MVKQPYPDFQNVTWVRYEGDKGTWWPGLFVSYALRNGLVVTALCRRSVPPDAMSPTTAFTPGDSVPLFWIPYNSALVVATAWSAYDRRPPVCKGMLPPAVGDLNRLVQKAVKQMDQLRSLFVKSSTSGFESADTSAPAPVTPSTICASACSTVTPASRWDGASPACCRSSFQGSSPLSPTSSESSTGTELDIFSTQLSLGVYDQSCHSPLGDVTHNHQKGVGASAAPALSRADGAAAEISQASTGGSTLGSFGETSFASPVRQRGEDVTDDQAVDTASSVSVLKVACDDREGKSSSRKRGTKRPRADGACSRDGNKATDQKHPAELPAALLGNPTVGHVVCFANRNSQANDDIDMETGESGRAHSDATERSAACAEPLNRVGIQWGSKTTAGFHDVDNAQGFVAVRTRSRMSQRTPEQERRSTRASMGRSRKAPQLSVHAAASCYGFDAPPTTHLQTSVSGDRSVEVDPANAEQLRMVNVTGKEGFKELFKKLTKLGWDYGGPVSVLSNDFWIVKPVPKGKARKRGVDKFATQDEVVRHVREILGLNPNQCSSSEENASDSREEGVGGQDRDMKISPISDLGGDVDGERVSEHDSGEPALEESNMFSDATQQSLTPVMQDLRRALEALRPSGTPAALKERTNEFDQVLQFVTRKIKEPSGGSMYLCGCPGTGKTQTMAHVQVEVARLATQKQYLRPAFHSFTGTAFTTPSAMHAALWEAVSGQETLPPNVEHALSLKLQRKKKPTASSPMIVVVVDEIDQLISENLRVLRKLFEWADAPMSRMILVGIANSISFDVGFSELRTAPVKVCFGAYSPEQLCSIIEERVGDAMEPGAVMLCAKKIAAAHGDARRAISVCHEAITLARRELQAKSDVPALENCQEREPERTRKPPVSIAHMLKALKAARVTQYADAISVLSLQAQIVLCVAAASAAGNAEQAQDNVDEVMKAKRLQVLTQGGLHNQCMWVWGKLKTGSSLTQIEFSGTIDVLAAQGLLSIKGKLHTSSRARQLILLIEFSDVESALGDQPFFKVATGR